jgi:hypothetical protein
MSRSSQQDDPYAGQYARSAIVFPRRTSAAPPAHPTRKRHARQPEPNHQQGSTFGTHPADEPYDTDSFDMEGADYPGEPVRPRSSAVRQPTVPSRRRETVHFPSQQPRPTKVFRRVDRATLVIWLCLALIVMVGGWWLLSTVASWWQGVSDDWKYGTPRTSQTDQFVGQGDSPDHPDHFTVVNLHGQVIVVQINPQHPQLDHIYGITTVSDPKVPVSLNFRPTGSTWAMYVIIGDTNPYSGELVSDGKQFVSPH